MTAPYETYLHMLVDLHRLLGPTRYLEIGVNEGHSLACAGSDTRLVGVDPAPLVGSLDHPDWSVVEATSAHGGELSGKLHGVIEEAVLGAKG